MLQASAVSVYERGLYSAHDEEDDDDQQNQSGAAAGIVAPPGAIGPGRQSPEQNQDQYDKQNCPEHFSLLNEWRAGIAGSAFERNASGDSSAAFLALFGLPI
jgi:hypothetical protein